MVEIPTRDQIAGLVGNDQRMIIALEGLFRAAAEEAPIEIEAVVAQLSGVLTSLGAVQSNAADILGFKPDQSQIVATLDEIRRDLGAVFMAFLPKPSEARFENLPDVAVKGRADGDLAKWDETAGAWVPISGVSGSFDADGGSPTITVTNGVITGIA